MWIFVWGVRLSFFVWFVDISSIFDVLLDSVEDVFVVIVLFIGLNIGWSVVMFLVVFFGWIILL